MALTDEAYPDFDSPIGEEADSGGFVTLEPGNYAFSIDEPVGREYFSGSEKMPKCWKASLSLTVDGKEQGENKVSYNLYLTKKQSWKIKQLFVGLGLIRPDEKDFVPPWNKIVGCCGVVEIGNHEYNGKTYNEVKRILSPEDAQKAIYEQTEAAPSEGFSAKDLKFEEVDAPAKPEPKAAEQPGFNFPRS